MKMIKFNYFEREYNAIEFEIDNAIKSTLKSGWYILGKEVKQFEKNIAQYIGSKYAVGVASGTDALILSLLVLGVKPGDEVITTDLTAYPTITAIEAIGAIPVAIDIDINTGLIDSSLIESHITEKTRAIIPVHLYGQACEMNKIVHISCEYNIPIIEDCAQAIGAKHNGIVVGTFGDLAAFSFYPTKNLGAYGDAGAICTNSKHYYEKLIMLRNYGQSKRYIHSQQGRNSRLDEIQAAILNVKIKYLDQWNRRRQNIAKLYMENIPSKYLIKFKTGAVFHLFLMRMHNRDAFMKYMTNKGVQTLIHYPIPVSSQKAYSGNKLINSNTQILCNELVSLPISPSLTDKEVYKIIDLIKCF
jgi:dTDP-4-amino-4,6-dideoxygalactose transaminase